MTTYTDDRCATCGGELIPGLNTIWCSLECEQEMALTHERAHAGVSDPDICLWPDGVCRLLATPDNEPEPVPDNP